MAPLRKPFQGVWNIVRFNWHFYILALGGSLVLLWLTCVLHGPLRLALAVACVMSMVITILSLLVSWYIYDRSGLYRLEWSGACEPGGRIVNIHAGFDETSSVLQAKYAGCELAVLDFYDPSKHTEVSIRRARRACPPFPGTRSIDTTSIPLPDDSADAIFVIFAAHEIRRDDERAAFFRELRRIVKSTSRIVVVEHIRDLPNFLAYTIGFLHFFARATWIKTFRAAGLEIIGETKVNPFITAFTLTKHGTAS